MSLRVTILIDDDLYKRVRLKQSKLIAKTNKSISFSSIINDVLVGKYKI